MQAYFGLAAACEMVEPLWQDTYIDEMLGAAELSSILQEMGMEAIPYAVGPGHAHALCSTAWAHRWMTLVQVRKANPPENRRWAVVSDFDGKYLQWAECVDVHDPPGGPTRWEGYFTGQMVVIEREVPEGNIIIARMEGTLPFTASSN
jgi:hypothetical protein